MNSVRRSFLPRIDGLPATYWYLWAGMLVNRVGAFVVPFLDLGITQSPMLRLEPPGVAALLPGYGPYRMLIDAGLTEEFDEAQGLLIGSAWAIGLALVVVLIFTTQTRIARRRARHGRHLWIKEGVTARDGLGE